MCGIAGFLNKDGVRANDNIINNMLEVMNHRGPDDHGIYTKNNLAFGHVRLSIVDLSKNGSQPFTTDDGQGMLVYNGELYNYKQLKSRLIGENVRFKSETDTEVFLYALHNWGVERAVKMFEGMFAFAYFDFRSNSLWIGRDRLGIKPLYYKIENGMFIFASEIKSILQHPEVKCEPDIVALATHISHEYLEGTWTSFKNIVSALPGTIYRIGDNSIDEITYFDVIDNIDVDALKDSYKVSPHDYVPQFQKIIRESVHSHMMGDVPIATFCSGGVDSSLITAYAKELNPNLVAYVASVEDALPESDKARVVGKHLGVEIREVKYTTHEYLYDWPKSIWYNDSPPVYRSDQAFLAVAKACRRDGIKVVLTGEGSDELFGGYEWHEDAYKIWRYRKLWIPFLRRAKPEALRWHWGQNPIFQYVNKYLAFMAPVTLEELEHRTFSRFPTPNPNQVHQILRKSCVEDGAQRSIRYQKLYEKLSPLKRHDHKALLAIGYDDMYGHLLNLLQRNDRMGMAASIESRIPFLDNSMIDFSMNINPKCRYRKKERKWLVKEAAAKILPKEIVYAPKMGFSTSKKPYKYALPLIRNGLVPQIFNWDSKHLDIILNELNNNRYALYSVIGVELWARIFINGESPEELGDQLVFNYKHNISL